MFDYMKTRHAGTVRDFKNYMVRTWGPAGEFTNRSEAHRAFWEKLNHLGAQNMKSSPPEEVPDIDATVILTNEEWWQLERELDPLR